MKLQKLTSRFLFVASLFLLLAGITPSAQAQSRDPSQPQPTPGPPPIIVTPGRIGDRIITTTTSTMFPGIFGRIRWKKDMGLPFDRATNPRPLFQTCTMFRVRVTVVEGAPGTFGYDKTIADQNSKGEPTEENGYYICDYAFSDTGQFPQNRTLTVKAELDDRVLKGTENDPWRIGSDAQVPPGYERTVMGSRGVTLTSAEPRVTVDFELAYRPLPSQPR